MTELPKIGGFINPTLSKGDTVEKPDTEKRREREQHARRDAEEEPGSDATFFSIDAIRALLEQEKVEISPEINACFARLKDKGVASIPIRDGQPILEAIEEAAKRYAP